MAVSREIKLRIKSVKNISQITKAMELVSAAKMRKAQAQALASRSYSKLSSSLLENLAAKVDSSKHPLLNKVLPIGQVLSEKVLVVLVTPNKGLAGALNSNLVNKALGIIKTQGREKVDFVTVGKKGADLIHRMNLTVIASFEVRDHDLSILDAKPIAQIVIEEFLANHYNKVFVIYTDFISTLSQAPNIMQLLPFVKTSEPDSEEYLFEPSADEVLETLIQRTIDFGLYQALVEATASEHSARMVAMRNANEAATDLMDDLQLTYNQARQAGITRELSEISAAKLAMEN